MTEDEARTKWCPMVRIFNFDATASGNRDMQTDIAGQTQYSCIASDCMMWQWGPTRVKDENGNWKHRIEGQCGLAK